MGCLSGKTGCSRPSHALHGCCITFFLEVEGCCASQFVASSKSMLRDRLTVRLLLNMVSNATCENRRDQSQLISTRI